MCVKDFDDDTISDTETLSLTYLPDRVHWPTMTADPAKPNQYTKIYENYKFLNSCFQLETTSLREVFKICSLSIARFIDIIPEQANLSIYLV